MVFDKYRKQYPEKPRPGSISPKPEKAMTSSYLSRLAREVGSSSQTTSQSPQKRVLSYGRDAKIWAGSTPKPEGEKNVRANIERRLHWVETAFKKPEGRQLDERSKVVSSVRNRINALLTYDLSPKVRSELELIERESVYVQVTCREATGLCVQLRVCLACIYDMKSTLRKAMAGKA